MATPMPPWMMRGRGVVEVCMLDDPLSMDEEKSREVPLLPF